MGLNYSIVANEEDTNITVFVKGAAPLSAHNSHPNFEAIRKGLLEGDESVLDLFSGAETAARKFEKVTERVSVQGGTVFFDGDRIDNSITEQIARFIREGVEDWKPLVAFLDKVMQNPNEHSREQLYTWLTGRDFTITESGDIVGYKGVGKRGDGIYESTRSGTASVNGETQTGYIKQKVGDVVEMPRSAVTHDPATGCSYGLHVGTHEFASTFGSTVLEVHLNPRDVVSVPTECDWAKVRCCRYVVVGEVERKYSAPVIPAYDGDLYDDDDECPCGGDCQCGDPQDETLFELPDVPELEESADDIVGNTYEDTDKRRAGRTFVVTSVEGDFAVGTSLPQNVTRKIRLDRLDSRKYRKLESRPTSAGVAEGDVYEDTDKRRAGRTVTVVRIPSGSNEAWVVSSNGGHRWVKLSRLTSRKYRKV